MTDCFSDCGLRVETKPDCLNGKPVRLVAANGMRVWLTSDQAEALGWELIDQAFLTRPLAGAREGVA